MTANLFVILLLALASTTFGKYVYVKQPKMNWFEARNICQTNYTEMAPINNEYDTNLIKRFTGNTISGVWFGLIKDGNKWNWSGGEEVTTFFWDPTQPDMIMDEDYGILLGNYEWHDAQSDYGNFSSLCYKVHVVRERKTWEEALQYCRSYHLDLASVVSVTEMRLIRKELNKFANVTEHVWIGLNFLAGDWQWTDGQQYELDAWDLQGEPLCPAKHLSCAALQVLGVQNPTGSVNPHATNPGINVVSGVRDVQVWKPYDCDKKLHFLCY